MLKDVSALPGAEERDVTNNQSVSVLVIKNFGTSRKTRSKQTKKFRILTNYAAGTVAGGEKITELDLQDLCGPYPADSLRALRRVHQCYRRYTTLTVQGGLWTLSPIGGVANAPNVERV